MEYDFSNYNYSYEDEKISIGKSIGETFVAHLTNELTEYEYCGCCTYFSATIKDGEEEIASSYLDLEDDIV